MIVYKTDNALRNALQKNVIFEVNGKILREGKLILFNIKDFFITFSIVTSKNISKTYELPVPFAVEKHPDKIVFDYSIDKITKNNSVTNYLIKTVYNKLGKKSKLYDSKLTIKYVE